MVERKKRETSLTDEEVAVVKTLLTRGGRNNQQILGIINAIRRTENRPDTNGGRISEVKTGKPRYANIQAASNDVTDSFVTKSTKPKLKIVPEQENPLTDQSLQKLLPIHSESPLRFNISETDVVECKETFNFSQLKSCLKTIAGFANNKGGYLIFGIENGTWEAKGITGSSFDNLDTARVNTEINNILSSEVRFLTRKDYEINGVRLGVIYIYPAESKPVIATKNGNDGISTGHIYYRYTGETRQIGPSELSKMIQEQVNSQSKNILQKHIGKIIEIGPDNAAIMNTLTGEVEGKSGNFLIDESLLADLKFIREGEFVEKAGAPTLQLIGNVEPTSTVRIINKVKKESLYDGDLILDFLQQAEVESPTSYIRQYANSPKTCLPIYYFIEQANVSIAEAVKLLKSSPEKHNINNKAEKLKKGKITQGYGTKSTYPDEIALLINTEDIDLQDIQKVRRVLLAMHKLNKEEISGIKAHILNLLLRIHTEHHGSDAQNFQSSIRGAISFIDHTLFRDQISNK